MGFCPAGVGDSDFAGSVESVSNFGLVREMLELIAVFVWLVWILLELVVSTGVV